MSDMNYLNRFLCLGALVLTPALFADTFAGKISLAITDAKGKTTVMNQTMKGTATRLEAEGMPGAMIMDFSKKEMIMLMNDDHMYMVMPIKDGAAHEHQTKPAAEAEIVVTGKTETILGYHCKQIMVTEGKETTEMWVAEGLGLFAGMGAPAGGGGMFGSKKGKAESAQWERALKGKGGFPLRVISRNAAGKETYKMEAKKIEKGGVTDADFLPPKDFQKFEMPDMGNMNPFK